MISIITIADTETGVKLTVGQAYTTVNKNGLPNYDLLTIAGITHRLDRVSLRDGKGATSLIDMKTLLKNIAEGLYRCVSASI